MYVVLIADSIFCHNHTKKKSLTLVHIWANVQQQAKVDSKTRRKQTFNCESFIFERTIIRLCSYSVIRSSPLKTLLAFSHSSVGVARLFVRQSVRLTHTLRTFSLSLSYAYVCGFDARALLLPDARKKVLVAKDLMKKSDWERVHFYLLFNFIY